MLTAIGVSLGNSRRGDTVAEGEQRVNEFVILGRKLRRAEYML